MWVQREAIYYKGINTFLKVTVWQAVKRLFIGLFPYDRG